MNTTGVNVEFDLQRLREKLDRYGPDLESWPERERALAHEWLVRVPGAREEIAAARRLETWLRELPAPRPAPSLREAILLAAPGARPVWVLAVRELWYMLGGLRIAAPAFALALAAGLTIGVSLGVPVADEPAEDLVELSQVDVDYADF